MNNQQKLEIETELEFICPTDQPQVEAIADVKFICPQAQAIDEVKKAYQDAIEKFFRLQVDTTPVIAILVHQTKYSGYSPKHNVVLIRVNDNFKRQIVDFDKRPGKQNHINSRFTATPEWAAEILATKMTKHVEREVSNRLGRAVQARFFAGPVGPDYMHPKDRLTEECLWDAIFSGLGIADPSPLPAAGRIG
jgi:hypothetical protein